MIAGDQMDIYRPAGARYLDRFHDLPRPQRPHTDAAAQIEIARDGVERRRGTDEIARDEQVQFRPHRYAVRVEAIVGRPGRVLRDEPEIAIEFGNAPGVVSHRAAHHPEEKATAGNR